MKVLAVVVTYNRCALLERCLNHLEKQIAYPDQLVVIDNGSTDGTAKMLAERFVNTISQPNLGSAGGWHRGIECALNEKFDAVWLMDDDGYPAPEALKILKAAMLPDRACVSSVVVREDEPSLLVFPLRAFGRLQTIEALKKRLPEGVLDAAHLFNGALVSLSAVRKTGNVTAEYFIYGEEVDFFLRLKKIGKVVSILSALHYHPDVNLRPYSKQKVYYYLKNMLIINARYYRWPALRSLVILVMLLFRIANRNGIRTVVAYRTSIFRAVARGFQGKLGHDFR
ncbi:MAG: glycosyltransferase [Myxococcota bacterium]